MSLNDKIDFTSDIRRKACVIMCNINKIMEMLDWHKSEAVQQKGIRLATALPKKTLAVLQKHYDNPGWWDNE